MAPKSKGKKNSRKQNRAKAPKPNASLKQEPDGDAIGATIPHSLALSKMTRVEKFAFALSLTSLCIPLFFLPPVFLFPFVSPKVYLFRCISVALFASWLYLWRKMPERYGLKPNSLLLILALWCVSMLASSFFGVDWHRSIWGTQERMLGLVSWVHYVAYFASLACILRGQSSLRLWLRTLHLVCLGVGIIALIQKADPNFLFHSGDDRVGSTLGNPIYLSGLGVFAFFLGALSYSLERRGSLWRRLALWSAFMACFCILAGESRSAVLALFCGLCVFALMQLPQLKLFLSQRASQSSSDRSFWLQKLLTMRSVVCTITLLALCSGLTYMIQPELLSDLPFFRRINLDNLFGIETRWMAWDIAFESWLDRPLLGWGPGNYYHAFNDHFNANFLNYPWAERWFDDPHNFFLSSLCHQGGVGFVLWILLYACSFKCILDIRKKTNGSIHTAWLMALLCAHFIHHCFVFEDPSSLMLLMSLLAFVSAWKLQLDKADSKQTENLILPRLGGLLSPKALACMAVLLVVINVCYLNILPAFRNHQFFEAIHSTALGEANACKDFEGVLEHRGVHKDDAKTTFVQMSLDCLAKQALQFKTKLPASFKAMSSKKLHYCYELLDPKAMQREFDVRNIYYRATIAQELMRLSGDSSLLANSSEEIANALVLYQRRHGLLYLLSDLAWQQRDAKKSLAILEEAVEKAPLASEGHWRLALAYYKLGQQSKAASIYHQARKDGVEFRGQGLEVIGAIVKAERSARIKQKQSDQQEKHKRQAAIQRGLNKLRTPRKSR